MITISWRIIESTWTKDKLTAISNAVRDGYYEIRGSSSMRQLLFRDSDRIVYWVEIFSPDTYRMAYDCLGYKTDLGAEK